MISRFIPRMDILPPAQKKLWTALQPTAKLGFVLYGGTAIALRLGHRLSVDFDFFSEKHLDYDVLRQAFPFIDRSITLQDQPNTLSLLVPSSDIQHDHVKISFFGDISFGRLHCTNDCSKRRERFQGFFCHFFHPTSISPYLVMKIDVLKRNLVVPVISFFHNFKKFFISIFCFFKIFPKRNNTPTVIYYTPKLILM